LISIVPVEIYNPIPSLKAYPSVFSLEGKLTLVTGGTRGIRQAMTFALAKASANIILVQVISASLEASGEVASK